MTEGRRNFQRFIDIRGRFSTDAGKRQGCGLDKADLKREEGRSRPKGSWADWFANLLSFFTMVLLFVAAWLSYSQLNEARLTADASIESATAAANSIDISRSQLAESRRTSNDSARTQILANLPIVVPTGNNLEIRDGRLVSHQTWQNFGETRMIAPSVSWGWGPKRQDSKSLRWHLKIWNRSTWAKGVNYESFRPISGEEATSKPFVCGRISYLDVFPDVIAGEQRRTDHLVEYCIKIQSSEHLDLNKPHWGGEEIDNGYCYDETCQDYDSEKSPYVSRAR